MCNHYRDQMELWEEAVRVSVPGLYIPGNPTLQGHIYPKRKARIIRREDSGPVLVEMRWGVWPFYAREKPQFITNARRDGLLTKPTWKQSAAKRRCLIPTTGYYEPGLGPVGAKGEVLFTVKEHTWFFVAGLWDADPDGSGSTGFAMVTTEPNTTAAQFHDRMPVVLDPADALAWLGDEPLADDHLMHLCRGLPADALLYEEIPPTPKLMITRPSKSPAPDDGPELF